MLRLPPLLIALMILGIPSSNAEAEESGRNIFDFSDPKAASQWQIVNDGVMGGRSSGQAAITSENQLRFSGYLSLENNGGFASVRSSPKALRLQAGDVIVMRVRGDGRKYTFNLYVPNRRTAFSYRIEFQTQADQWIEIRMPLDRFVATSFGRQVRGVPLNPAKVNSVGILLGDKKAGRFSIHVDWIRVASTS